MLSLLHSRALTDVAAEHEAESQMLITLKDGVEAKKQCDSEVKHFRKSLKPRTTVSNQLQLITEESYIIL